MLRLSHGAPRGVRAARRWAALAAVTVGCATLGACSDDYYEETTGPERYGYGPTYLNAFVGQIHGCWSRTFAGGTGYLDEELWTFGTNGTGTRSMIRKSLAGEPISAQQSPFTWSASSSSTVLVQFGAASIGYTSTVVQLPATINNAFGNPALILGGGTFVRCLG